MVAFVDNIGRDQDRLMKPELETLIKHFRAAQDVGVANIRDTLKLPFRHPVQIG